MPLFSFKSTKSTKAQEPPAAELSVPAAAAPVLTPRVQVPSPVQAAPPMPVAPKPSRAVVKPTYVSAAEREAEDGALNYGMDRELAAKALAKRDPVLEASAREWIEDTIREKIEGETLQQALKSGVVLCRLANAIEAGVCKAPSKMAVPFKQMENISNFIDACVKLGLPVHAAYPVAALYEDKDMSAVCAHLTSLHRVAQKRASERARAKDPSTAAHAVAPKPASTEKQSTSEKQSTLSTSTLFLSQHVPELPKQSGASVAPPTKAEPVVAAPAPPAPPSAPSPARSAAPATPTPPAPPAPPAPPPSTAGPILEADARAAARTEMETEARTWIEAVLGAPLDGDTLEAALRSGVALCRVLLVIAPGCCAKPSKLATPFKQMENIANYLHACEREFSQPAHDAFQTIDLYEGRDMGAVLTQLHSLGRLAQQHGYTGPSLGARLARATPRTHFPNAHTPTHFSNPLGSVQPERGIVGAEWDTGSYGYARADEPTDISDAAAATTPRREGGVMVPMGGGGGGSMHRSWGQNTPPAAPPPKVEAADGRGREVLDGRGVDAFGRVVHKELR